METGPRFGDWRSFIDESLQSHGTSNDFNDLDTNESRIKYILDSDLLRKAEWVQKYFDECDSEKNDSEAKSSLKAEHHRKEGNGMFLRKQYKQALKCYNEAVLHAPSKGAGKTEMALSLGNRSAALVHLQHYKESLVDISLAMRHGYPDHLGHKLLQRRALCYRQLADTNRAIEVLDEALKCVGAAADMDAKKKARLLKDMRSTLDDIKSDATQNNSEDVDATVIDLVLSDKTPTPVYGWNKHVRQASASVRIALTEDMGRHIVIDRPIQAGDALIVDVPFAAVLLPEYYELLCHHCFAPLLVVVPCHRCALVRFCSETCRKESWDVYHHVECRYADLLYSIGIAHLSLRVVLTAGLDFLFDFRKKIQDAPRDEDGRLTGFNEDGSYERGYLATYALQDHSEDFHPDDLFQYSLTATLLLRCLRRPGSDLSLVNSVYIGGLLLRHICQLVCNAHAITRIQASEDDDQCSSIVSTTMQVRIATAIYSTTSLTNHSCEPNVILGFDKKVLVVRATEDIPAGGSVFVSYGPTSSRMSWAERQQCLKEQYFFTCHCKACQSGDRMEERSHATKCPRCAAPLDNKRPESPCPQCHHAIDTTRQRELLSQADTDFIAGLQRLEQNNVKGAIEKFLQCLAVREANLCGQDRSLGEVWDVLARCYAMQGCYVESATYLQRSLTYTETVYGDTSVELAHELQKLAEVLFHCGDRVLDSIQTVDRAMQLFTLNYGPECEAVAELGKLKARLLERS